MAPAARRLAFVAGLAAVIVGACTAPAPAPARPSAVVPAASPSTSPDETRLDAPDPEKAKALLPVLATRVAGMKGVLGVHLDDAGSSLVVETCGSPMLDHIDDRMIDVPIVMHVDEEVAKKPGLPCGCGEHAMGDGWPCSDNCNACACIGPDMVSSTLVECIVIIDPEAFRFLPGSTKPLGDFSIVVESVGDLMTRDPTTRITIQGHDRTPRSDGALALERARFMQRAISSKGIAASRLVVVTGRPDRLPTPVAPWQGWEDTASLQLAPPAP